MSLSSFLQKSDVRARFRQEFSKPTFVENKALLAPPLTPNSSIVGTAFDYLMRFYLKTLNPQPIQREWAAESTVHLLKQQGENRLHDQAFVIVTRARENYAEFLKARQITDDLIRSTLQLAKLDAFLRARKIDPNLDYIEQADIEDVKALINLVDFSQFTSQGVVLLNPTFGLISLKIGGADADFVVDDLLIDIKTKKRFELARDDVNQLMGYYTLSKINEIDGAPEGHEIKRLGIYFARYAQLFVFNVSEVVNPQTFSQFLEWFQQRILINDY